MQRITLLIALLICCSPVLAQPTTAPTTMPISGKLGTPIDLFNGKDFSGWGWISPTAGAKLEDTWTIVDGAMHMTGKPNGYLRTDKEYGPNFVLIVEQRHIARGGGGILFNITGGDTLPWPKNMQVQGTQGNVGDLINMGSYPWTYDAARYQKRATDELVSKVGPTSEKPVGEFYKVEIVVDHGNVSITVNGKLQNTATMLQDTTGRIGFQAEGAPMEFKKVQLIPIEGK